MQPLSVNDFVETPLGRGTVVNFVRDGEREETVVLVRLDGTENSDRNWRAFKLEEVTKI